MGLFGYNKRDFEKNTQKFKDHINKIAQLCSVGSIDKTGELQKLLVKSSAILERGTYQDGSREYQKIDEEIDELLGLIENAVSSQEWHLASSVASFLFETIDLCRAYGKICDTDKERKIKRVNAELLGKIGDLNEKKNEITSRQRKVASYAASLPHESREKYCLEYSSLENEKKAITELVERYISMYNTNTKYLDVMMKKHSFESLSPIKYDHLDTMKDILDGFGSEAEKAAPPQKAKKAEDTVVACAYCGYPSEPGARFCKNCGQPLK